MVFQTSASRSLILTKGIKGQVNNQDIRRSAKNLDEITTSVEANRPKIEAKWAFLAVLCVAGTGC